MVLSIRTVAKSEHGEVCEGDGMVVVTGNTAYLGQGWQELAPGMHGIQTTDAREHQMYLWIALGAITRAGLAHYVVTTDAPGWMQHFICPASFAVYHDDEQMQILFKCWLATNQYDLIKLVEIAGFATERAREIEQMEKLARDSPEIQRLMSFQ